MNKIIEKNVNTSIQSGCSACSLNQNGSCSSSSGSCSLSEKKDVEKVTSKEPVKKQNNLSKKFFIKKSSINTIQKYSWVMVPLISLGGLWYHKIGLIMSVMLVFLLVLSYFRGRFWCGNICPRGAFLEIFIKPISFYGKIPDLYKDKYFRFAVVTIFMTVFTLRTKAAFGNWSLIDSFDKWGLVFATLCLVTTIIAVILGVLYSPRAWCSFCPMGTIEKGLYNINKSIKARRLKGVK